MLTLEDAASCPIAARDHTSCWAIRLTAPQLVPWLAAALARVNHLCGETSLTLRRSGPQAPGSLGSTADEIGILQEFCKSVFGVICFKETQL